MASSTRTACTLSTARPHRPVPVAWVVHAAATRHRSPTWKATEPASSSRLFAPSSMGPAINPDRAQALPPAATAAP